jgi:hypothetical protein
VESAQQLEQHTGNYTRFAATKRERIAQEERRYALALKAGAPGGVHPAEHRGQDEAGSEPQEA